MQELIHISVRMGTTPLNSAISCLTLWYVSIALSGYRWRVAKQIALYVASDAVVTARNTSIKYLSSGSSKSSRDAFFTCSMNFKEILISSITGTKAPTSQVQATHDQWGQPWARWEAIGSLVFNASNIWYFVKLILRLILGFNLRTSYIKLAKILGSHTSSETYIALAWDSPILIYQICICDWMQATSFRCTWFHRWRSCPNAQGCIWRS